MKITAIEPQQRNPNRVNISVNGAYAFSLDILQVTELGLRIDKEFNQAELDRFKTESDFGKAYARALDLIARRLRSEKEIHDYAWRKKWPPEQTDRVVERLKKRGYLNDERFAKAWAESRQVTKPISARRLRLELKQKGISDELIAAAIGDTEFDETDALHRVVAKKRRRYPDEQKFMQYLMRQGFRYDDIKQVLRKE